MRIGNDLGLHLRAAGLLAQLAERFPCEIYLEVNGRRANGKSIMSVLSLAAAKGSQVTIIAEGERADDAVAALVDLVERGFEPPGPARGAGP
ncbi:MAG: HPr family phosphocarrier protein [Deltaproteobacteria bacterium]|nr:HPr family phosphocarrier protein [Deltaproteobacteria bacterium]